MRGRELSGGVEEIGRVRGLRRSPPGARRRLPEGLQGPPRAVEWGR